MKVIPRDKNEILDSNQKYPEKVCNPRLYLWFQTINCTDDRQT